MREKCNEIAPQAPESPAELVRKSKEQAGALVSALQAHVAFLTEQLEKVVVLLPAVTMYERYAADLKQYGGIESPGALLDRAVITVEKEKELASLIQEKVEGWKKTHPSLASLAPTVYGYVYGLLCRNFGIRRLSRIPPQEYQEIAEFVKTLQIPSLADFGPLAAVLMVTRAMRRMSAARAAEMCGVTNRGYRRWEAGKHVPCPRNVSSVAQFIGMSERKVMRLIEQQRLYNGGPETERKAKAKPSRQPPAQPGAERGGRIGEACITRLGPGGN